MKTITVAQAKREFSELIRTCQHEEIIILRHGKPVARVVGVEGTDICDLVNAATTAAPKKRSK